MLFLTATCWLRSEPTMNALRGHLAEFGVIAPKGPARVARLASTVADPDSGLSESVRELGGLLLAQIVGFNRKIEELESRIRSGAYEEVETRRLMSIPGIGPTCVSAIQVFAPPMASFRRGRDFSAWLGLVFLQHSMGGKARLSRISKMGQRDVRQLLIIGAMTLVCCDARGCNRFLALEAGYRDYVEFHITANLRRNDTFFPLNGF